MTNLVTFEANTANGKPLEELARLVRIRQRELGETTSDSVVATMIRTLTSIRAATRTSDPKRDSGFVNVALASNMHAAWMRKSGHDIMCVRVGSPRGPRFTGRKADVGRFVVNMIKHYVKGMKPYVFLVRDRVSSEAGEKTIDYYLVALNEGDAREFANNRHKRRVATYSGMAKRSLGWLMHRVSGKNVGGVRVSQKSERIVSRVNAVSKNISGYDTGRASISVLDGLNYAENAVNGGSSGVSDATIKAANSIVGQINTTIAKRLGAKRDSAFEGRLKVPFPEVRGK